MNSTGRTAVFLFGAAGLLALLVWGLSGLNAFGDYRGAYGLIMNRVAPQERQILNVVTAVMFDYRGFDTLGEEFILFAAVTGVTLLLRDEEEAEEREEERHETGAGGRGVKAYGSDAVRWASLGFTGAIAAIGVYIIAQPHLSFGGGFQGGVIVASAWVVVYLAYGHEVLHRLSRTFPLELAESIGAGTYAVVGFIGMWLGGAFLANFLPLGKAGEMLSSGSILLINLGVAVEVSSAFVLLVAEFAKPLQRLRPGRMT